MPVRLASVRTAAFRRLLVVQQRRTLFGSTSWTKTSAGFQAGLSNVDPSFSPDLMPSVLSALLKLNDDHEEERDSDQREPWRVYESADGKGHGVRASTHIARGTRLVAERPLCVWPNGLSPDQAAALFDRMPPASQKAFMNLSPGHAPPDMHPVLARRATNGFAVQLPGSPTLGMVFANISRINHSCIPNASQSFNAQTFRMEVYAIRDIEPGEEICIEYLPTLVTQTKRERIASLNSSFMMRECLCPLCTSSEYDIAKSDARRTNIKAISEQLSQGSLDRNAALSRMAEMRDLLRDENYLGPPEFDSQSLSRAFAVFLTMRPSRD